MPKPVFYSLAFVIFKLIFCEIFFNDRQQQTCMNWQPFQTDVFRPSFTRNLMVKRPSDQY